MTTKRKRVSSRRARGDAQERAKSASSAAAGVRVKESAAVIEIPCSTAREFLAALHPAGESWSPVPRRWIFRGHSDSRWELIPSAFRPEAWKGLPDSSVLHGQEHLRTMRERLLLHTFGQALDRVGLPVPGPRSTFLGLKEWDSADLRWIAECGDLAALAQHHGLPTRLLDFTAHSYVAAYFAALDCADADAPELCVWAVNHELFGVDERLGMRVGEAWLAMIRAPRSSNPNLHAQSGLFVTWTGQPEIVPLDRIVQNLFDDPRSGRTVELPLMRKLTLPRSESAELLGLLVLERITGATMFPGVDGVVREMKELSKHQQFLHHA